MTSILIATFLTVHAGATPEASPTTTVTAVTMQAFGSADACKNAGRALAALAQGLNFTVVTACVPSDVAAVEVVPPRRDKNKLNAER